MYKEVPLSYIYHVLLMLSISYSLVANTQNLWLPWPPHTLLPYTRLYLPVTQITNVLRRQRPYLTNITRRTSLFVLSLFSSSTSIPPATTAANCTNTNKHNIKHYTNIVNFRLTSQDCFTILLLFLRFKNLINLRVIV